MITISQLKLDLQQSILARHSSHMFEHTAIVAFERGQTQKLPKLPMLQNSMQQNPKLPMLHHQISLILLYLLVHVKARTSPYSESNVARFPLKDHVVPWNVSN